MKHELYDREDELAHCKVCGGAEGTLPSECPGRRLTETEEASVWAGRMDYRRAKWWVTL